MTCIVHLAEGLGRWLQVDDLAAQTSEPHVCSQNGKRSFGPSFLNPVTQNEIFPH